VVCPVGVAPSRMVAVSASVSLPLHHQVQKFSSGTGSPGWSRKKGRKMVVVVVVDVGQALQNVCYCDITLYDSDNMDIFLNQLIGLIQSFT